MRSDVRILDPHDLRSVVSLLLCACFEDKRATATYVINMHSLDHFGSHRGRRDCTPATKGLELRLLYSPIVANLNLKLFGIASEVFSVHAKPP